MLSQRELQSSHLLTEVDRQMAKQQAEEQARSMQLNIVRLLFTAYLSDSQGEYTQRLTPVVSNAIYDSSEYMNELL